MGTNTTLNELQSQRIIPVIRLYDQESALFAGKMILRTGFTTLEITLTTPGAFEIVEELKREFPKARIGFGSIFSTKEIEKGLKAQGDFFVSPHLDEELLEAVKQNKTLYIPGVMTPSEIVKARKAGLETVKVFPVEAIGGIKFIQSLQGPFPKMNFIPTGGINLENIQKYLAFKNVIVGATSLIKREAVEAKDKEETRTIINTYLKLTKT